jgi:hypothetical protein
VHAKERRRDLRLELRRQLRLEAERLERRIPDGLGAERVEARAEMSVHAMRLDERHRSGDGAEEECVGGAGRRFGRRRCRCGRGNRRALRGDNCGATVTASVRTVGPERLEQPGETGMIGDDRRVAALEEGTPFRRDRVRILEVFVEQEVRVACVKSVDVVHRHASVLYQGHVSCGDFSVQRVGQPDRDRGADDEADQDDADREADEALLLTGHRRCDERDQERRRREPERPVYELQKPDEHRRRGDHARDGLRSTP